MVYGTAYLRNEMVFSIGHNRRLPSNALNMKRARSLSAPKCRLFLVVAYYRSPFNVKQIAIAYLSFIVNPANQSSDAEPMRKPPLNPHGARHRQLTQSGHEHPLRSTLSSLKVLTFELIDTGNR